MKKYFLKAKAEYVLSPLAIPGLALWLDAADSSTIIPNGSNVSNWADKSGNSRDLVQNTAARQPEYAATTINGLKTITFNGSNEFLERAEFLVDLGSFSIFVVAKPTSQQNQVILSERDEAASGLPAFFMLSQENSSPYDKVRGFLRNDASSILYDLDGNIDFYDNTARVLTYTDSESAVNSYVNGVIDLNDQTYTKTGSFNVTNFILGALVRDTGPSSYFNGELAEVLVYSPVLPAVETQFIWKYLNRWGL